MYRISKAIFSVLSSLLVLFLVVLPVHADGETIPASGEICAQGICNTIQITFPPKGGPVSGTLSGQGSKDGCTFNNDGTISGTFAGGDGGQISGSIVWTMTASCSGNSISQSWSGTWQGTLSAIGTGSGNGSVSGVGATWTLSFSGEDFQRILTPITKEYFKTTYGIDVVDGTVQWTERELNLLDTLIKKLPKSFWDKTKFTRIVRDKADIEDSQEDPNTYGWYYAPDREIRVFDIANKPLDFENDPNGDKQFIGTIVHEMTHAFQYYKDNKSVYKRSRGDVENSPLLKGFKESVRDNKQDFRTGWVWNTETQKFQFKGTGEENKLMTSYAGKNPFEDICESVMFYVVDPAKLSAKSPTRYSFIKEQMFGGLEYAWDY